MKIYFDQEKLDVYQEAIAFCGWVGEFLTVISAKASSGQKKEDSAPDGLRYPLSSVVKSRIACARAVGWR